MLPASSCTVLEPLQGPTRNLFSAILSPQLQQTPWQRSNWQEPHQSWISHCLELCWHHCTLPGPLSVYSRFNVRNYFKIIKSSLCVLHISRTLRKWTGCNSNLSRGKDRKHSRKHLEKWNKLASTFITEMLDRGFFIAASADCSPRSKSLRKSHLAG